MAVYFYHVIHQGPEQAEQLAKARAYAEKYTIEEIYADHNRKGPNWLALRQNLKGGDTVITPTLFDLGNKPRDALKAVYQVTSVNARVIATWEGYNSASQAGQAMMDFAHAMLEEFIQYHREQSQHETKVGTAKAAAARRGRKTSAEIEQMIRELTKQGYSVAQTVEHTGVNHKVVDRVRAKMRQEEAERAAA